MILKNVCDFRVLHIQIELNRMLSYTSKFAFPTKELMRTWPFFFFHNNRIQRWECEGREHTVYLSFTGHLGYKLMMSI